jgi:hypothetical protein
MKKRIAVLSAGVFVIVAAVMTLKFTGIIMTHGIRDVAVGNNAQYCGWYLQKWSVSFYCQSGH